MYFNEHIYFAKYEGELREKLLEYKFNNKAYLYKFFTQIILKNDKKYSFLKNYDIIIPVPIHKKRKLIRGYNQSELIARELSKEYSIKCLNLLYKIRNTEPQSLLNKNERKNNVKKAYKLKNKEIILNKEILLIDDIYTTGTTVNECSKILKQAGANTISVITIMKD